MAEKVHFLPVDLRIHRSQLMDLDVEYMNWWLRGIEECVKTDLATLLGWSKKAVEDKKRDYLTSEVDKLCSDPNGIYYLLELENAISVWAHSTN